MIHLGRSKGCNPWGHLGATSIIQAQTILLPTHDRSEQSKRARKIRTKSPTHYLPTCSQISPSLTNTAKTSQVYTEKTPHNKSWLQTPWHMRIMSGNKKKKFVERERTKEHGPLSRPASLSRCPTDVKHLDILSYTYSRATVLVCGPATPLPRPARHFLLTTCGVRMRMF